MIKRLLLILRSWINFYPAIHFSQDGEDIVLRHIFEGRDNGFYVDIGAFHPTRYSNTYAFYLRGWRGLNVDARPGAMRVFGKWRSRDINVEMAIGQQSGQQSGSLIYHRLNQPAMNSFDAALTRQRLSENAELRLLEKINMPVRPLSAILDEYMPEGQSIDFMSIDVEGLDLQVLKTNNWEKFRPDYLLVEDFADFLEDLLATELSNYLASVGYKPVSRMPRTVIFKNVKAA